MVLNFRHVGYVVEDLGQALGEFQRLFQVADKAVRIVPPYEVASDSRFAFLNVGVL